MNRFWRDQRAGFRTADERAVVVWHISALADVELFETLPEVGDPEKPRLVLFFR